MRVVDIITRLNIGGAAMHVVHASSRLASRGVETLLVYGSIAAAEGDMSYLLDEVTPRPQTIRIAALRRNVMPWSDALAWRRIYRTLVDFRPDVVHTHTAKAGALGRSAATAYARTSGRRSPPRIVHTYHGHVLDGYFGPTATAAIVGAERILARVSDRLVVVSPRLRTDLLDRHGIGRKNQYRVLPYGFNLERLGAITDDDRARARQTLDIPSAAGVVTSVGRLTAIKAHDLFLRVAAIVHRRRSDAVFLIAGDGELRADLEAQAARAGLQNCVRFLGWRRDLPVLYAASDIFLLTSRNEGTPVALIDGMAAACAAVATSVGGVPDVVSSSTVGLLGASGDADALAAHVTALLDNPSRRREMAEAGRRSVLSSFGIERMIDDVEALYGELLASAPASV